MNVHSQGHDGTADVEVVGVGQDGHEQLPELERHVVEQLHGLILKKTTYIEENWRFDQIAEK